MAIALSIIALVLSVVTFLAELKTRAELTALIQEHINLERSVYKDLKPDVLDHEKKLEEMWNSIEDMFGVNEKLIKSFKPNKVVKVAAPKKRGRPTKV